MTKRSININWYEVELDKCPTCNLSWSRHILTITKDSIELSEGMGLCLESKRTDSNKKLDLTNEIQLKNLIEQYTSHHKNGKYIIKTSRLIRDLNIKNQVSPEKVIDILKTFPHLEEKTSDIFINNTRKHDP